MAFIEVDAEDFAKEREAAFDRGDILFLKFGSEYCDPCHALGFELEEIDELYDNVTILEIDTDESQDLAEHFDIMQLPTMMIYKDRKSLIYKEEGVILYQDIQEIIGQPKKS